MSYNCDNCKKKYTSYQSYWNHNKKFHTNIINNNINNNINCDHCNKGFLNKYTLKNHLKICHIKKYNDSVNIIPNINNDIILETPIQNVLNDCEKLKLQLQLTEAEQNKIKEEKDKIIEENKNLKLKLQLEKLLITKCKMHHNTFKSLNNKLIYNSMNNSNNTINNITNNFKIYAIGKENLVDILTLSEKSDILRSKYNCLERIVEIAHCSKYDQFKNIIITNLKDNHAFKYDDTKGYFICINKNEIISDLVCERLGDIKEIYEELSTTNKLDINTKRLIKEFLEKINIEDKYIDNTNDITYSNFKSYNEQKVKILIYNNSDKINRDLTIIFDTLPNID